MKHEVKKVETSNQVKKHYSIDDFKMGDFVGCIYDDNWWMGQITGISQELMDVKVSFMQSPWPSKRISVARRIQKREG